MEVDEVKSDLYALRQLYGLLQSLVTRENIYKSLDERALQLLKSLLDNATQKLSTTHHEMKADYHQSNVLNMQANITKPEQIVPSQAFPNNTNNNSTDFASSSTGFSTPTSIGFDGDIDDTNSDDQHGTFSKDVSNAIKQIDSRILALHVQTSGSRVSYPSYPKPKLKDVDTESLSHRYVRGLRIPSLVPSNDNVYRNNPIVERHVVREPKPSTNNTRTHHGRMELYENRRSSEPKNYSTESRSAYSSDNEEEENSEISGSEVSEGDDHYGYDDYDNDYDDDDDEIESSGCSNCSRSDSNSSYGTAQSGTNNYPRRRVEDRSERVMRISTLRRIKNKLGLIFHHHHHYHHHHQYHHDHDHSPLDHDHDHRRTSSKPIQRMFRNENNNNNNKRERDDRRRNNNETRMRRGSLVANKRSSENRGGGGGAGGRDVGHFRALVEALTRHVGGGRRIKRGGVVKIGNYRRGRVGVGFNKKTNQPYKLNM